jgi:Protein of unknown function (DUF1592)/Protein of unknown function (DUF1588)/Protein of unknown function (DUF1595)/Protein of unknown function (DUF1587)/Protein of unknown function (DUF1585)
MHQAKAALFFAFLWFGCEGRIFQNDRDTPTTAAGGGSAEVTPCTGDLMVGNAPMRRLSHEEYRNSIADIQPSWGTQVATEMASLTQDSESLGFRNGATFLDVKPVLAQQYMDAAEKIAASAVANLKALLPCDAAAGETPCSNQFIRSFGRKIYRRALTDEEAARYAVVYANARTAGYDFKTGVEWIIFSFLQSPGFLYRVEIDPPGSAGIRPLSSQEIASRMSYLLWQSGPDETLLTAAEAGQLASKQEIADQARRMLEAPQARRLVSFFDQWLQWDRLESLQRDPKIFLGLPGNLGPLLRIEAQTFVEKTVFDEDHTLSSLLSGPYSFVNQTLAQHYGLPAVVGASFQRMATPGRGGLMMLGGSLATRDLNSRTSIVHRGVALRTSLMCQVVPAPPPNIPALGPIDASLSQAQRLAEHRKNAACSGCHNAIDPLGQTLEGFDAVGRIRTKDEAGHTVETAGELTNSRDLNLNGPVANGLELMQKFAQSSEVRDCFATQLYRFSMGRKEETADACSQFTMKKSFESSGGNVKELVFSLTQLIDFTHKQVQP